MELNYLQKNTKPKITNEELIELLDEIIQKSNTLEDRITQILNAEIKNCIS